MKHLATLFFVLIILRAAIADETNSVFVTDDNRIFIFSTNKHTIRPSKIEEAMKSRESLPAKLFPEGNWGEVRMGIQVSLRFEKLVFTNKEPINAVVLIRNTSTNFFMFSTSNPITHDGSVFFHVLTESNVTIPPKKPKSDFYAPSAGAERAVFPYTQRKYIVKLNNLFDFTSKSYVIQASAFAVDNLPPKSNQHDSICKSEN